jgi:hypothetical protein
VDEGGDAPMMSAPVGRVISSDNSPDKGPLARSQPIV